MTPFLKKDVPIRGFLISLYQRCLPGWVNGMMKTVFFLVELRDNSKVSQPNFQQRN